MLVSVKLANSPESLYNRKERTSSVDSQYFPGFQLFMLTFVIPLKCKQIAKSWPKTCKLLERTLKSICQQTDADFKAVVVCQKGDDFEFSDPRIFLISVDFKVPSSHEEKEQDKGKKIIAGLEFLKQFNPSHAMVVDADDCLDFRLVEFVNKHPDCNGWVISQGYVYQENSPFIYYRKSHFYTWCGTCNIVRFDLCPLPEEEGTYPDDLVDYYSGRNHEKMATMLKERGFPLEALPFIGAVYIIGNSENIYQTGFSKIHHANRGKLFFRLKELRKFRFLTPRIMKRFGIYQFEPEPPQAEESISYN